MKRSMDTGKRRKLSLGEYTVIQTFGLELAIKNLKQQFLTSVKARKGIIAENLSMLDQLIRYIGVDEVFDFLVDNLDMEYILMIPQVDKDSSDKEEIVDVDNDDEYKDSVSEDVCYERIRLVNMINLFRC